MAVHWVSNSLFCFLALLSLLGSESNCCGCVRTEVQQLDSPHLTTNACYPVCSPEVLLEPWIYSFIDTVNCLGLWNGTNENSWSWFMPVRPLGLHGWQWTEELDLPAVRWRQAEAAQRPPDLLTVESHRLKANPRTAKVQLFPPVEH